MRKVVFVLLIGLIAGGIAPLFSQQRMDANGDGYPELVYSHPGKKYVYRIDFDFNKDGKYDIILLVNEDTGKYVSLDVVRTTWPIPTNMGTQQWIQDKKSAGQQFWNNRTQSDAKCDICHNKGVNRNEGYVLSSQDVLANLKYVNYEIYYSNSVMHNFLGENFDEVEASLSLMEKVVQFGISTPWLLCETCIHDWIALKK